MELCYNVKINSKEYAHLGVLWYAYVYPPGLPHWHRGNWVIVQGSFCVDSANA